MEISDFDYTLPADRIAQAPADVRESSRLLVIDRASGALADRTFRDLPALLCPGDLLVVNDSRVIPARIYARETMSGRAVELLFVEPVTSGRWRALVRPGRRCQPGAGLTVGDGGGPQLTVVGIEDDGTRTIEWLDGSIDDLLQTHGLPPLPPYIERYAKPDLEDQERYQTVYARVAGSIAAPTAGLHFSAPLLDRLRDRGVELASITLHVGPATFRPIRATQVEAHALPAERVTISPETASAVNAARAAGRRIVAVGTTTTRTLEGCAGRDGALDAFDGRVGLYIYPGHRFRVVGALVTNFHLPRTSLLVLAAAFAGPELILRAYRHAVDSGYRFYSYGDATLIV